MRKLLFLLLIFCSVTFASQPVVNVYIWNSEVPENVFKQFTQQTGIKVNLSYYDSNEILYAKLKANPQSAYDVIMPSSYYVSRMSQEGMLHELNQTYIPNIRNVDPKFLHLAYDPDSKYSIQYTWGATGIFVNKKYFDPNRISRWRDLWSEQYRNQLLLLNDPREVFSMAMITLGYSANDSDSEHIHQAYQLLVQLSPNIKLFNSDAIPSIFIDGDVRLGMAWNGDIYRGQQENPDLVFIYPKEGFVIWGDCLAIPRNAPHLANAYKLINFLLRPEIANQVTIAYGYGTTNKPGKALLPEKIRNNPVIYPDEKTMARGQFQTNVSNEALMLYAKYWERLKIGG